MSNAPLDAIALLKTANREIETMLARLQTEDLSGGEKELLVDEICQTLQVHAQVMEEVIYPAFRAAGVLAPILDQAEIDQKFIRQIVDDLQQTSHYDKQFEIQVAKLLVRVRRRILADETDMFPDAELAGVDRQTVGRQLEARRSEMKGHATPY